MRPNPKEAGQVGEREVTLNHGQRRDEEGAVEDVEDGAEEEDREEGDASGRPVGFESRSWKGEEKGGRGRVKEKAGRRRGSGKGTGGRGKEKAGEEKEGRGRGKINKMYR